MFIKVMFFCVFITLCLTACESKDKGLEEMKKIESKWLDGVKLAESTPRIALSPQVGNLQAIKRDLEGVGVGNCLAGAKIALNDHMSLTIQGFLEFMDPDKKYLSSSSFTLSDIKYREYIQGRDKCLGA